MEVFLTAVFLLSALAVVPAFVVSLYSSYTFNKYLRTPTQTFGPRLLQQVHVRSLHCPRPMSGSSPSVLTGPSRMLGLAY